MLYKKIFLLYNIKKMSGLFLKFFVFLIIVVFILKLNYRLKFFRWLVTENFFLNRFKNFFYRLFFRNSGRRLKIIIDKGYLEKINIGFINKFFRVNKKIYLNNFIKKFFYFVKMFLIIFFLFLLIYLW